MAKPKKVRQKGLGYLYKRDSSGKEHPASSKVPGIFWLATAGENGKRIRRRLEVDGKPVTDLETARAEQMRVRVPYITHTEVDAVRAELQRLETKLESEQDTAEPPLLVSDAWQTYIESANRPECGKDTLKGYKSMWDGLVGWCNKHSDEQIRYVRDISEKLANGYASSLSGEGLSANTFNKRINFFRLFFRVLGKQARIEVNPFDEITRKRMNGTSRRELSMSELRDVLLKSEGELQRLFWLGTFTGLRLGDCCTLRWDEIDLEAGVIRRIPRKTRARGKAVLIGIPPPLQRLLACIERNGPYVCPESAKLYLTSRTKQGWISYKIQRFFRELGIQTTIKDESKKKAVQLVGFHSLRHTYASLHAASGTPQALIQENMGHSNPAMTEHYQHISEATARKVAAALDIPQIEGKDSGLRMELLKAVQSADEIQLAKLMDAWKRISSTNDLINDDGEQAEELGTD